MLTLQASKLNMNMNMTPRLQVTALNIPLLNVTYLFDILERDMDMM